MAVNFPINPTPGQSYTAEGGTWVWNGTQWTVHGGGITEGEADARYLRLIGGTLTGQLVVTDISSVKPSINGGNPSFYMRRFDNSVGGLLYFDGMAGATAMRNYAADGSTMTTELRLTATDLLTNSGLSATLPASNSLVNRDRGDARYHRLNTAIEALNSVGITPSTATSHGHLYFRRFNATNAGLLYYDYAADEIELRKYDAAGTGAQTSVRLKTNDVIIGGGTALAAPVAASIMTMARADARYLTLTGGTLTGDLIISNGIPGLRFHETDTAVGMKHWLMWVSGGHLRFSPRNDDGTAPTSGAVFQLSRDANGLTDITWPSAPATSPNSSSLLTRAQADNRYIQVNPAWAQDGLGIVAQAASTSPMLQLLRSDTTLAGNVFWYPQTDTLYFRKYAANGSTIQTEIQLISNDVRLGGLTGTVQTGTSVLTMTRGDARYRQPTTLPASASAFSGTVTAIGTTLIGLLSSDVFTATSNRLMAFGELICSANGGPSYYSSTMRLRQSPGGAVVATDDIPISTISVANGAGGALVANHAVLFVVTAGADYYIEMVAQAGAANIFSRTKSRISLHCL